MPTMDDHFAMVGMSEAARDRVVNMHHTVARTFITLNPEEVRDAGADGVDLGGVAKFITEVRSGCFRRGDRWWHFDGVTAEGEERDVLMHNEATAALDRIREYWRRRALVDALAKDAADALDVALKAARAHAMAFAKIADDGVMSIDRAQDFRRVSAGFGLSIREVERSRDYYRHAADLQAFKDEKGDIR